MNDPEISQDHLPSLHDVTSAYADVLEQQRTHAGIGAGLGNLLHGLMRAESKNPDASAEEMKSSSQEVIDEAVLEGDMNSELQGIMHEDLFMRIGIKLLPLNGGANGQKRTRSMQLEPMVDNVTLFTDFIGQQTTQAFEQDPEHLKLFTDIITNLRRNIAISIQESGRAASEEERSMFRQFAEDSLRTFVGIDDAYRQAGLDTPALYERHIAEGTTRLLDGKLHGYKVAEYYLDSYQELNHFVTYWGRGVLPEYIATGAIKDLADSKMGYFDGGHDKLAAKADSIVLLTMDERTHDFGVEAAQALLTGIERTAQVIDTEQDGLFATPGNKALLDKIAQTLRSVIQ